jgi:hypothetical protein
MPHNDRFNYKAKWLAAIAENPTANVQPTRDATTTLEDAKATVIDNTLEAKRLHDRLIGAAQEAKKCLEVLDDCNHLGEVSFGTLANEVDLNLHNMPSHVIVSRLRDTLKAATTRVGLMSAAYEELEEATKTLAARASELREQLPAAQHANLAHYKLGANPTAVECDEFISAAQRGELYSRSGGAYTNIEDDDLLGMVCLATTRNGAKKLKEQAPRRKVTKERFDADNDLFT